MFSEKPVPTPDQARGLFPDHALRPSRLLGLKQRREFGDQSGPEMCLRI